MRAIDADYLKEHLTACTINGMPLHRMYTELDELLEVIDDVPTIEPERKKGHWLLFGDSYMEFCKCSNCGHSEDTKKNFCPECGADMRGGQDEWVLRG